MLLVALLGLPCVWAAAPELEQVRSPFPQGARTAIAEQLAAVPGFSSVALQDHTAGLGHTVRVFGVHDGIRTQAPVAVVRFDESDQPRLLARFVDSAPTERAPHPLHADALHAQIVRQTQQSPASVGPVRWHRVGAQWVAARWVWLDHPWRGLAHPRLLADAETGLLISILEDATHGLGHDPRGEKPPQADVFPIDPVTTPDLARVELPASTRHALLSEHFRVHRCTDLGTTYAARTDLGEVDLRWCVPVEPIPPDGGQWIFDPTPYPLDPRLDEDDFAGPNLLWHGEATLVDFTAWGLPLAERPVEWQRLDAMTNHRSTDLFDLTTMSDPTAPLTPYDNAYFRRGRESSDGTLFPPELVFGQGSVGDFAYDADVIIHELGHFAVWTQGGPSSVRASVHGNSAEPGALNEGLADYFATVRTHDPEVGTYTGESLGRPYIRTLDGDARCPDHIFGQVHADSQPFSQALWTVREALSPAEQDLLDRSVMDALPAMGSTSGFAHAVDVLVGEVELQLGPATADTLAAEFSRRAVDACDPHVPVVSGEVARSYTLVPAFYEDLYDGAVPGFVQFVVPDDGPLDVTVSFVQTESTDVDLWTTHDPQDVELLVHSGGPIQHTGTTDPSSGDYAWTHNARAAGVAVRTGTLDPSLDGRTVPHTYEATLQLVGPGPHHLQLANLFERSVVARDVTFTWQPIDRASDSGTPPQADSKPKESGCTTGGVVPGIWALLLAGMGLIRRERPVPQ